MTDALQDRIQRGKRAEALLTDPLLIEAFETLKRDYITAWLQTQPHDGQSRELLYIAANQVDKVRERLGAIVGDGRIGQAELEAQEAEQNQ
jgi:hypothetical protein